MNPDLANRFAHSPKFGLTASVPCKICGRAARAFDAVDFYRFCSVGATADPHLFGFSGVSVPYFRCEWCEFLFTNFCDNWGADDFLKYIYNDDYVLVDPDYVKERPTANAAAINSLIPDKTLRILDYGSGAGIFSRLSSEFGFKHVESYDPFSNPVKPSGQFDVITCFEVIEHSPDPVATFSDIFSFLAEGGILIFSQIVQPDNIFSVRCGWWYIGPRNGHISTFTHVTLQLLLSKFGKQLGVCQSYYVASDASKTDFNNKLTVEYIPFCRRIILAPGDQREKWHDPERNGDVLFAWTASNILQWVNVTLLPGKNNIVIPIVNQIVDGFVEACEVYVGERLLDTKLIGNDIVGHFTSSALTKVDVVLKTPQLMSPESFGRLDSRKLGIAVRFAPPDDFKSFATNAVTYAASNWRIEKS